MTPEEREVKLDAGDDVALPDFSSITGVTVDDRGTTQLCAVYWDTTELALARAGVGLRHRNGTWTYKGRTRHEGHSVVREEREIDAVDSDIPVSLREAVGRVTDVADVHPVVEIVTDRRTVVVRRGNTEAEVVHDAVTVRDGVRVADRHTAFEVEFVPAAQALADDVVGLLVAAGARIGGTSKYVRGLRALGHDVPEVTDG